MKNVKKLIIPIVVVILVIAAVVTAVWIKKYKPSKEVMSLDQYFAVGEGEVGVVLQNQLAESRGIMDQGEIYVNLDLVKTYLNSRFYWDANENLLIYTTSSQVITASNGSTDYYTNKSKSSMNYPIVKTSGDTVYVALDYVKQYSALEYTKYDKPDRVVINYRFGKKEDYAQVNEKAELRYKADIKSDILVSLTSKDVVRVLGSEDENHFVQVMEKTGVIGYVKASSLGKTYQEALKTDFKKEKYSHILLDEKVNLAWHQVTTVAANDGLLNLLNSTKGVNVVVPTWFMVSGNKGEITSLASDMYVSRAHSSGVQVWGLCSDFSNDSKIGKVLGSTSTRQKLEKNLVAEAIRYSLDGINIDFEYVKSESGEDFTQFIRELGIMCRNNGIILSIDNYPVASYSEYYNRPEQATVADYVITMAYDEYFAGSEEAGPVSSLSYVQDSTTNILEQVPEQQAIIGLPFYCRLWKETTKKGEVSLSSVAYSMDGAASAVKSAGATLKWDDATGMNYAEYKAGKSIYKIWLEDNKSMEAKVKAVTKSDVAGLAFWKLGMENSSVWDTIIKYNK